MLFGLHLIAGGGTWKKKKKKEGWLKIVLCYNPDFRLMKSVLPKI